ncbi:MAG TPA: hypothetical protein VGS22_30035 [Thermoanaerobaculia bacterium]|jgi:hypothetical protein|nr:hypothetical protein [Thermoanaerobaculia bacterium]
MARFKLFVPLVFVVLLAVPSTASAGTLSRGSGESWSTWMGSIWAAIGCILDPNGSCAQEPRSTIGCGINPGGHCGNAPAEIGCTLDPGGHCGSAPAPAEIGCTIDPNGRCRD